MSVGRPLKFTCPIDLQQQIDAYFDKCEAEKEHPTVMGLALALDCDRQTLLNYQKKEKFFGTIKRAKNRIEHYLELCLYRPGNVTGIIFNLKNNFGWQDSQEIHQQTSFKIGNITKEDAEIVKEVFDGIIEDHDCC